jgi:hypothetical protein
MKRSLELVGLGLFICLAPGGLARGQVAINVSPSLPSDIAGAPRRLHCSKRRPSRGKSSSHSIGPQWRASAMLPTQVRNSARAAARWSGRRSAAKSKSSILPRTARVPPTPRRRRTWGTTLRRLIFTEPNQCQLVLDRSCPPRQHKDDPGLLGLTGGGKICVNQRCEPIPPDVIAVNLAAHVAITSYDTANGIGNSPWLYYKLVSVQASPFDVSTISPTDPIYGPAAFFQANIVVETD